MNRTTIAGLAIAAAAALTLAWAPTAASATEIPQCERGQVASSWDGGNGFTLSTQNGASDCGVWLTSYTGAERQLTPGDYSHHQIAREWAWAQITAVPTVYTVALPACDNVQVDAYLGALQLDLPHGDLGAAWIAGGVIERPGLECQPEPQPPVVTEPPVVVPPVVTPEPEPTPEETPSTPTTPAPEPSEPPTEQPTEPSTPPTISPKPEQPDVDLPETPAAPVSPPSSAPPAATPTPVVAPTASPSARLVSAPTDSLAYTGAESNGPLSLVAGGLLLAGISLAVGGHLYRRRMDKRETA